MHSELIRLRFLDYVAAIGRGPRSRGSRRAAAARSRSRAVTRGRLAFHSFRKCFVRALEMAGIDRDRAALVIGHERGFTFRVYNPEGPT